MGARVRASSALKSVTPDIVAAAYSSGDVIGTLQEITDAVVDKGGTAILQSIVALDKANQKSAIDLIFFNAPLSVSPGADNAAYSLDDSDLSKFIGRYSLAAANYVSSGTANADLTDRSVGLVLQAAAGKKSLYVLSVSRGTPTYASATDLLYKLGLLQD